MRCWKYIILLLALAGCTPVCDECGGKESDAQITFLVGGQQIIIDDYGGSTIPETMTAAYTPSDSMLYLTGQGNGGYGDVAPPGSRIFFLFRCLPFPSVTQFGLPDTGTILLNLQITPPEFGLDTEKLNSQGLNGGAILTLFSYSGANLIVHTWCTDLKHTGTLKITDVDTIHKLFSGTFNFVAIDTAAGSSMADTVSIDNGVISKMRLFY